MRSSTGSKPWAHPGTLCAFHRPGMTRELLKALRCGMIDPMIAEETTKRTAPGAQPAKIRFGPLETISSMKEMLCVFAARSISNG
mmetsp:Transcript_45808/g.63650  ORF Transcript_45808/g.63650 Transcript_45808/m.63650 type:complete len:85 (+) Transcript_45808:47-301(+)